ncbi:MAG: sensor histidine kinase [Fimbriimonas sp.]
MQLNEHHPSGTLGTPPLPEAEVAPLLMWMSGREGLCSFVDEGWRQFTGRDLHEELGKGYAESIHPEDRADVVETFRRHVETREPYTLEYRLRRHDGEYRWILDRGSPYCGSDCEFAGFVGVCVDVTEQRVAREALRESQEDLRRLNAELERRVQERTAELTTVNKELESFTYSVSHDLRAPLRAISGYASILMDEYGGRLDDEGRRMLSRQVDAAGRMEALIGDLLQYSRLGRGELSRADLDLSRLGREVAEEISARNWGVPVRIEVAPGMRTVADPRLLRTVVQNLIENAVKYSGPKGEAVVSFGEEDGAFFVRDRGIGFDTRHADKLFEPFERLHRATDFPGTGIGLANVRKVVERHGGRVWAESVPGEGSVFRFTIA